MDLKDLIAQVHQEVQEHRKAIGLPPWDFTREKKTSSAPSAAESKRIKRAQARYRKFIKDMKPGNAEPQTVDGH